MRGVKRTVIVLAVSIVLGGCHATYKQVDTGSAQSSDMRLARAQSNSLSPCRKTAASRA